jgi:hypothetical protein
MRTKHGIERIQIADTVWEDALKIYSSRYSIGLLICDDCFLENFVEGKGDERVFSEEVEKVIERLKANDRSLQQLDLRDEILGGGAEAQEQVRGQQSSNSSDGEGSLSDNVDLFGGSKAVIAATGKALCPTM